MTDKRSNLIWLDLEMTGLNPQKDRIIEIATVVTDHDLNILAHGPELAINQPVELLKDMDEWNTSHHTSSGLLDKVMHSIVTEQEAELRTLEFLMKYVEPGFSPMCGNSIYQDRRFLNIYMPKLEAFFHYRNLDVSSLKILAKSWAPDVYAQLTKESNHRALDDVIGSIDELKFYRQNILKI
ncbi:MAG TPA: oligoribonuclease [Gammaproteobacteria bacterium]|nr:oligoribonuclease [Gammaproteobacteria bacterium]